MQIGHTLKNFGFPLFARLSNNSLLKHNRQPRVLWKKCCKKAISG